MAPAPHPFNIKAVVRETGIFADTIRAWERRFGIPSPERTEGGHRRYSQRDIDTIHWLKAQMQRGLSISAAITRLQALQAEGTDPLSRDTAFTPPLGPISTSILEDLRMQWVEACLTFSEERADDIISGAFARFPAKEVALGLLLAGLADVGSDWKESRATVQQEHFASQLVSRRLETLIAMSPRPTRRKRIVVALPPGESHAIPSLAIAFLLRMRGFPVIDLGANVPVDRIQETLAQIQPALVILSAQTLPSASELRNMAALITEAGLHVGFGGSFFNRHPRARASIPGTFLGDNLEALPSNVEDILRKEISPVIPTPADEAALEALFQAEPAIERMLWDELRSQGWDFFELNQMLSNIHSLLEAALKLGSLTYLGVSQDELLTLLSESGISAEHAHAFLLAYQNNLQDQLPDLGLRLQAFLAEELPTGVESI